MSSFLLYLGAALVSVWGIAHLVPTRSVIAGFGDISDDNRHIIAMEWVVEGVSMLFIGALVIVVTALDPVAPTSLAVYVVSTLALVASCASFIRRWRSAVNCLSLATVRVSFSSRRSILCSTRASPALGSVAARRAH